MAKKKRVLTEEQKVAAKIRHKAWRDANKEHVNAYQRKKDKERYDKVKQEGGEAYEKLLQKARSKSKLVKDLPLEELEIRREKGRQRNAKIKADPEKYVKQMEKKSKYQKGLKENDPEGYQRMLVRKRNWWKNNPARGLFLVRKRQVLKLSATPKWADEHKIERMYAVSARLSELTGIKHHVDHIVPLKHPLVCGLHVHWNLRVITAEDNLSKSNKYETTTWQKL